MNLVQDTSVRAGGNQHRAGDSHPAGRQSFESLESRLLFAAALTVADDLMQSAQSSVDALLDAAAGRANSPSVQLAQAPKPKAAAVSRPVAAPITRNNTAGQGSTTGTQTNETAHDAEDRPDSDFRFYLKPGTGFTGPTIQPNPIGNPTDAGYDAKAIARWDVVPYQTFDDLFHVGVVAFHMNGIDRVEFSVNGGTWTAVRTMTKNPQTDVYEYTASLKASDFQDGQIEVRAIAYPKHAGEARVLDSLELFSNFGGSLQVPQIYVSPSSGNDNNSGSSSSPVKTLTRAMSLVPPGGMILLTQPGVYHVPDMPAAWKNSMLAAQTARWVEIRPTNGITREQVIITQPTRSNIGLLISRLKFSGVSFDFSNIIQVTAQGRSVWFDNVNWFDSNGWAVRYSNHLTPTHYLTSSYLTNSLVHDMFWGPVEQEFIRSTTVRRISADAFMNSRCVINTTVQEFQNLDEHHSDLLQYFRFQENILVYGMTAQVKDAQSIFVCQPLSSEDRDSMSNSAFVNIDVDYTVGTKQMVSQYQGRLRHLLFLNLSLTGQEMLFRNDGDPTTQNYFRGKDVIFDDWQLHPSTIARYVVNPPPGVTFR